MSGRIRTIKPALLEDSKTASLTPNAFRLFIGAIVLADDYGNFRAEPRKLLGDVFWAQPDVTADDVSQLLFELASVSKDSEDIGLIRLYSVRDQIYGHIRTWSKHQRIDKVGPAKVAKHDDEKAVELPPTAILSRIAPEPLASGSLLNRKGNRTGSNTKARLDGSDEPPVSSSRLAEGSVTEPATPALQLLPGMSPTTSPEPDPIREVFDHWLVGWKKIARGVREPKLDEKRRGKVRARLREGYSVADLKRAIDGMWATPWNIEKKFWDLELVCRDAAHVDRFAAVLAHNAPSGVFLTSGSASAPSGRLAPYHKPWRADD